MILHATNNVLLSVTNMLYIIYYKYGQRVKSSGIITELKWLRTGYLQNRSYENYSFIDLIGEKSNICGIKKKGKKEGRKEERKDTRIM